MERHGRTLQDLAALVPDEPIALASITASELPVGIYRAGTPERRLQRERFVEALLSRVPAVPFDLVVARMHARLWAQLAEAGQLIGPPMTSSSLPPPWPTGTPSSQRTCVSLAVFPVWSSANRRGRRRAARWHERCHGGR